MTRKPGVPATLPVGPRFLLSLEGGWASPGCEAVANLWHNSATCPTALSLRFGFSQENEKPQHGGLSAIDMSAAF
jgi:hypothetical protein